MLTCIAIAKMVNMNKNEQWMGQIWIGYYEYAFILYIRHWVQKRKERESFYKCKIQITGYRKNAQLQYSDRVPFILKWTWTY